MFFSPHKIWHWFWEALLPPKCLFCAREGSVLCVKHQCFPTLNTQGSCPHSLDGFWAAAPYYDPTIEKTVEYFKYHHVRDLGCFMAQHIQTQVPKEIFSKAVIIPIPLYWSRQWWRGFNQAGIMAQHLSLLTNQPLNLNLKRQRKTQQQAKLNKIQREKNLTDAFVWKSQNSSPKKVVLIDDVAATGSTLQYAAETLRKAGTRTIYGVVFARGKAQ